MFQKFGLFLQERSFHCNTIYLNEDSQRHFEQINEQIINSFYSMKNWIMKNLFFVLYNVSAVESPVFSK